MVKVFMFSYVNNCSVLFSYKFASSLFGTIKDISILIYFMEASVCCAIIFILLQLLYRVNVKFIYIAL